MPMKADARKYTMFTSQFTKMFPGKSRDVNRIQPISLKVKTAVEIKTFAKSLDSY